MVFAVRCPSPNCRKYMLVEEIDRGQIVNCLICKTPVRVASAPIPPAGSAASSLTADDPTPLAAPPLPPPPRRSPPR